MRNHSRHRRFPLHASLAFALLLSAGCVGIPTVLPPEARTKVAATEVRSYVPQAKVDVQYMRSGYGSGMGLIGAIVDASVDSALASSAASRAKRVHEAIADYDFRGSYWTAVSNAATTTSWLQTRIFTCVPSNFMPVKAAMVAQGALFNIGTDHFLTPDHRVLGINMGISLFLPQEHKKAAAASMMLYHSKRVGNDEGDKALARWTADDGAAYRRTADEGIRESARLLSFALAHMYGLTNAAARPARVKADFTHGRGDFGIPIGRVSIKGAVLDESSERIVFQAPPGNLFSLPRDEVEITYLPKK